MNDRQRSASIKILLLSLALVVPLSVLTLNPNWVSQLAYAVEVGQANVAEEQLAVATDLSQAFRQVAKSIRPSVVSITSVKKASAPTAEQFRGQLPEELHGFFGDEEFERFFSIPGPRQREQRGLGSGVIVTEDGYILTNFHVAGDADQVEVTLSDGREFTAKIVGGDQATDLAVLKIDAKNLKPAKLGKSQELAVGEWVLAVGSPFGLEQTVTAGIISATGRANVGITDYEDFIQTDAAINPGNSGGPLLNLKGEVVGINTAIASRTGGYMGIGFAIPSEMAKHVMTSIIDKGFVTRGRLGALIQDLNRDLAASFNYDSTEGVLISDVVPGSPAAKAGLQSGDIVVSLNGEATESASELRNAIANTAPGTEVTLSIFRNGKTQNVAVTVDQLDEQTTRVAMRRGGGNETTDYGMVLRALTPELARQLELDEDASGVVVAQVERGSVAAEAGLRPGDVIIAVGNQPVGSISEFKQAISELKEDAVRLQVLRDGLRRFVILSNK